MKKAFLAGVLLMFVDGCATLKHLFTFEPDNQKIEAIWREVKTELQLNPGLPLPSIKFLAKRNRVTGSYFYDRKEIEIYGFYGDSAFYKTVTHELLHYGLDIQWQTRYPPNRADDHKVIPRYLENIRKRIKYY